MSNVTSTSGHGQRTWLGGVVHIIGLFTSVIGAGIIYLFSGDGFITENAKNALNWHIFFFIVWNLSGLLIFSGFILNGEGLIGPTVAIATAAIGAFGLLFLFVINILVCFLAAIKAGGGKAWKYPTPREFI